MGSPIYINGRFAAQKFSGVQRFAMEMARALQARGSGGTSVLLPPGAKSDLPSHRHVGRLSGQVWEQIELPAFTRNGVLVNLGNTAPLLARRQVVVIHDTGVFSTPEAYSWKLCVWYKFLQGWLVRRRIPIVTVSRFSRGEIIRHLSADPQDVTVISEGADHMARIAADAAILQKHGLQAKRFVLVVGNLAAHKNLPALSKLAAMLSERGVNLVITGGIGGGAFQSVARIKLPQPALYVGRISDGELKALYQSAMCFVFPSLYEGFGLPVVEAMATGCPVVAADIPVFRELFEGAVQFCDPHSPADIAMRVIQLLDDHDLQARLRTAGLDLARDMTWAGAASELAAVISAQLAAPAVDAKREGISDIAAGEKFPTLRPGITRGE
jgi:glycosyltransferase involved in cell wall biosynthesis